MDSLSDLNKKERDIRSSIASLMKQFRSKEISKKDFDKAIKARNRELQEISDKKGKLIGETMPPLPPPPRPPDREGKGSGLDAIKKSILEGRGLEPPGPPVIMKMKPPKPKVIIREKIKKVPVIREKIKRVEVPVIKKVKTPVIKEVIKEVPVIREKIREIKTPSGSDELARRVAENSTDIKNIKVDITRNEQELSQFLKEVREAAQRIEKLEGTRSELKTLKSRIDKIDFQGLTQEIYTQFDKMNSSIRESEKKTDDLVEKMNVELKTIKERIGEASQTKEDVMTLDVSNMRRDMESLKQKSQYIEQHLENVDMRPIVEMIREVENKVNSLKASSALIIE